MIFGSFERSGNWEVFLKSLPILIVLKLFAFLAAGVYRGIWRYTSVGDIITFGKAIILGSALSVFAILLFYRFQDFSRAVFVLDGIILLFLIGGSRFAFRLIREMLPVPVSGDGRRALIYGAGDGGEMLLRELRNNPKWNYQVVGFVDDDPTKADKMINGLRVFDANGSLEEICLERDINTMLVSTSMITSETLKRIRQACRETDVELKSAQIKIEPMDFE